MCRGDPSNLAGYRLLVVEDDYILASCLAWSLKDRGVEVIGPAASIATAQSFAEATKLLDGAVLDINLGGEMVFPVADELGV